MLLTRSCRNIVCMHIQVDSMLGSCVMTMGLLLVCKSGFVYACVDCLFGIAAHGAFLTYRFIFIVYRSRSARSCKSSGEFRRLLVSKLHFGASRPSLRSSACLRSARRCSPCSAAPARPIRRFFDYLNLISSKLYMNTNMEM